MRDLHRQRLNNRPRYAYNQEDPSVFVQVLGEVLAMTCILTMFFAASFL